ncbi:hypothetical protein ACFVAV_17525 [Nocardia sp. NPDC057663]|uniref:hypothetical protein n=1 Tax=Nocardia sp. NPDC057663 TaxID=3346201 RepID=UPI003672528D
MTAKKGRFVLRWAVAASVVMALVGCGESRGTTGVATSAPGIPTAVSAQPRGIGSMNQPCFPQPGFYPAADAYAGPAPHPVAVFDNEYGAIWNTPLQPPEWMNQSDPLRYQLVVCLGTSQDGGELIQACEFVGDKRLPLFRGRYVAKVYEAKSAKLLGTEVILGDAYRGCPIVVRFAPNERQWLFSNPDLIELQRVLGKYVYR